MAAMSAVHPFSKTADQVLAAAKHLSAEAKWTKILTQDGTDLFSADSTNDCPIPHYKVETVIEKPMQVLKDKIWKVASVEDAQRNDPKVASWKLLTSGANWKAMAQINAMGRPCWDRQTVFCQTEYVEDDGKTVYLVAHSVEHPMAQREDKMYVRTKMHMSVYEFCDLGGSTRVTRFAQVD